MGLEDRLVILRELNKRAFLKKWHFLTALCEMFCYINFLLEMGVLLCRSGCPELTLQTKLGLNSQRSACFPVSWVREGGKWLRDKVFLSTSIRTLNSQQRCKKLEEAVWAWDPRTGESDRSVSGSPASQAASQSTLYTSKFSERSGLKNKVESDWGRDLM